VGKLGFKLLFEPVGGLKLDGEEGGATLGLGNTWYLVTFTSKKLAHPDRKLRAKNKTKRAREVFLLIISSSYLK